MSGSWPRPGSRSTRRSDVWLSQSVFQLAKGDPRFPDQALMVGFTANQITIGAIVIAVVFGAGLLYWGNRFKSLRRTTIIGYGVIGGAALVVSGLVVNHFALDACPCWRSWPGSSPAGGLFVLAGPRRRPSASWPTSRERLPGDRGAIMGLYSVFLGDRPDHRVPPRWRWRPTGSGIDGLLVATRSDRRRAVPLSRLRRRSTS